MSDSVQILESIQSFDVVRGALLVQNERRHVRTVFGVPELFDRRLHGLLLLKKETTREAKGGGGGRRQRTKARSLKSVVSPIHKRFLKVIPKCFYTHALKAQIVCVNTEAGREKKRRVEQPERKKENETDDDDRKKERETRRDIVVRTCSMVSPY